MTGDVPQENQAQTLQPRILERSPSERTGRPGARGEPATPTARAPHSVSARVHESEGPFPGAQWPPDSQAWTGAPEQLQRWAQVCSEEPGPELLLAGGRLGRLSSAG